MADIEVHDELHDERYEALVDGTLAGFTAYRERDGVRVFIHTEVFEGFEGRGLGTAMVAAALADTRAKGLRVEAACPFVRAYIERHPDVADVVTT